MSNFNESLKYLESRIAYLDKHVQEQDSEIFKLSQRIDSIIKISKDQKAQILAILELGLESSSGMPADEKPPHY